MGRTGNTAAPDLAQHFTPAPAARLLWELTRELAGPEAAAGRIVDPAAGDGALLEAARRGGALGERLEGVELDAEMAARARRRGLQVRCGDGLLAGCETDADGRFDIALGNPPFGRCSRTMGEAQLDAVAASDRHSIYLANGARPRTASQHMARLRAAAIEHLFLERALQLVRPGGLVGFVLPQGLLSNARTQGVRDWILRHAEVLAVVALPDAVFRTTGLNAKAGILILRRRGGRGAEAGRVALVARPSEGGALPDVLDELRRDALRLYRRGGCAAGAVAVAADALAGQRWDAGFWLDDPTPQLDRCPHPLHRLGDHVDLLTYGPIVTGQRPQNLEGGIRIIGQSDFTELGLRPAPTLQVAAGSIYDPPRSRVRPGDLLVPRSGAGSLGRNRMAVYTGAEAANVSCFVDLVRLRDLNAFYAWLYLRTATGWGQIRRLINGVGVPNISFAEIRSLQVPWIAPAAQRLVEERYRREVLAWLDPAGGGSRAAAALGALTVDVERLVSGRSRALSAAGPT